MGSKGAGGDWESAQRIRKEPRVLIYAPYACPAQSQLRHTVRMCVCVKGHDICTRATCRHMTLLTHGVAGSRRSRVGVGVAAWVLGCI